MWTVDGVVESETKRLGDFYVVWSHEHGAWWGPGERGYVKRLGEAGIYTREHALHICANAILGTASRIGALPEIPVSYRDISALMDRYPGLKDVGSEAFR